MLLKTISNPTNTFFILVLLMLPEATFAQQDRNPIILQRDQEEQIVARKTFMQVYGDDGQLLAEGQYRKMNDQSIYLGSLFTHTKVEISNIDKIIVPMKDAIQQHAKKHAKKVGTIIGVSVQLVSISFIVLGFRTGDEINAIETGFSGMIVFAPALGSIGYLIGYKDGEIAGSKLFTHDLEYTIGPDDWEIVR